MKLTKKKALIALVILAVLAFAFWYGGDGVGSRGWKVQPPEQAAETGQPATAPSPAPAVQDDGAKQEPTEKAKEAGPEEETKPQEDAQAESQAESQAEPEDIGRDQYYTDPVPEGRPKPVEPQNADVNDDAAYTCTLSISCSTILSNMEYCSPEKAALVPVSGVILAPTTVTFREGESVFDVLQRTCQQQGIHMEFVDTPIYNSAYIEGIANLYEFDVGQLSGWMYRVNGWFPNYGCSRYKLSDGDVIEWVYTCDLGYDVGGGYAAGGS